MTDLARGTHGRYFWLQSPVNARNVSLPIATILRDCPGVVRDRYVIVTSLDSGPLQLTTQQIDAGWERRGRLALSPKILLATEVPFEWFDEWLIFGEPTTSAQLEVFVNYGTFSLAEPNPTISTMYVGSDPEVRQRLIEAVEPVRKRFWTQLEICLNRETAKSSQLNKNLVKVAVPLLTTLANETGGQAFFPKTVTESGTIVKEVILTSHTQYLIGYKPAKSVEPSAYRRVKVNLADKAGREKINAAARAGYTVPEPKPTP